MTKEYIKEAYERLRKNLGRQPTDDEFYQNTNVTHRQLIKAEFRTYSQLVEEMGDTPRTFKNNTKDKDEFYVSYGDMVRQMKRIPSTVDWEYAKRLPSVSSYKKKFGLAKWQDMMEKFLEYAEEKEEWQDVIPLFPKTTIETKEIKSANNQECYVYFMHDTKTLCYKIGISNEPDWRERTLQSEKPSIKLIAAKKFVNRRIAANIEKALHESYSHKRKRGEWFNLDQEDIEEIKSTLTN